jgi:predicted transcriptional regulator
MKKILTLLLLLIAAYFSYQQRQQGSSLTPVEATTATVINSDDALIADAFRSQRSDVPVTLNGVVSKVLSDDNDGSRHQRFIIRLTSGQTLLVAHNIDLAERVEALHAGDAITLRGEYEWNNKGGVLHWTHRDPAGKHAAGWIQYQGRTYQ